MFLELLENLPVARSLDLEPGNVAWIVRRNLWGYTCEATDDPWVASFQSGLWSRKVNDSFFIPERKLRPRCHLGPFTINLKPAFESLGYVSCFLCIMDIWGNNTPQLGLSSKPFPFTAGCLKGGWCWWYNGTQYKAAAIRRWCSWQC